MERVIPFNGIHHPRDMGAYAVRSILTHLATELDVAASTAFRGGSEATEIVEGFQPARRTKHFAQDNRLANAATLAKQRA